MPTYKFLNSDICLTKEKKKKKRGESYLKLVNI